MAHRKGRRRVPRFFRRTRTGRFLWRHRHSEEVALEAAGINIATRIAAWALGAAAASAAVTAVATQTHTTYHPGYLLSKKGAAFIARNEGLRTVPYNDPFNCTVGVGHLIHMGPCTAADYDRWRITIAQAMSLLLRDSSVAQGYVRRYVTRPINQPQFDALVDFTFNVGGGGLARSNVLSYLNTGDPGRVPAALLAWSYANGRYLAGLHTRRVAEGVLFVRGYYGAGIGSWVAPKPRLGKALRQAYLPKRLTWRGRPVQTAVSLRPLIVSFLEKHRALKAFSGFRRTLAGASETGDHRCGFALDLVPVAGATTRGYGEVLAGANAARKAGFAYVEPLSQTWRPGNHHLHISFRRCPTT